MHVINQNTHSKSKGWSSIIALEFSTRSPTKHQIKIHANEQEKEIKRTREKSKVKQTTRNDVTVDRDG